MLGLEEVTRTTAGELKAEPTVVEIMAATARLAQAGAAPQVGLLDRPYRMQELLQRCRKLRPQPPSHAACQLPAAAIAHARR